jgi:alkanesulfonate monooxygenase SsuD/methylene tetrahydromethanopterin reductase-like flavin-dependent oxidoreductase (luciferase family)
MRRETGGSWFAYGVTVNDHRKGLESEASIIGTPARCVTRLKAYVTVGIEQLILIFLGDRTLELLGVFTEPVIPGLK